jgi:sensor domain CHASE-containing protein
MALKAGNQSKKRLVFLICGILFSAAVALFYYQSLDSRSKKNIENIRTIYTERTENLINNMFHKTDVLAAVVKLENGDITEDIFDKAAALVYQENSGIRGIQYMPGAVVTYSYPLAGNEAVMGKNFLEIPERRADCLLAINTKSIALSGPYHLIQGGLGLVARNPVFLTDKSGKEYFWGFSTIVLDLPDALTSVGLDHLPESGYEFQLFCVNENNEKIIISGNENLDMDHAVYGTVQVPNHEWTLAITDENPHQKYIGPLVVFAVGMIISLIVWKLYSTIASEHEAIDAKDAFFSNISHDMRTPLNAVLGFTSLAKSDRLTVQQKDDYLNKIETSGRLLLDLINDTLTISKASNGKIVLRPEPCRTDNLGATVLPAVQELAKQKGVQLIIEKSDYRQRTILADRLNSEKDLPESADQCGQVHAGRRPCLGFRS